MKSLAYFFILLAAPIGLWAEPAADIPPPLKRAGVMELARNLLLTKPIETSEEELVASNPFNPVPPVAEATDSGPGPSPAANDVELLKTLAAGVTPSGTIQLGGRQLLLFGQKKLKVGDHIPVVYQGGSYELELRAFDRTSFTLRLKNEEITRPIKASVKKP